MTDKTLKLSLRNVQAINDKESDLKLLSTAAKKSRRVKRKLLKRKIQHNWKEEEINRLIAAVEMEPSIWMEGPKKFNSTRRHGWNAVVAQLNIADVDVNEAKTKWSSLRVTYRLNLSKINNSSSTNCGAVVWRYFNQMSFLSSSCYAHQSDALLDETLTSPAQSPLRPRTRGHPDCSSSSALLPVMTCLASETPEPTLISPTIAMASASASAPTASPTLATSLLSPSDVLVSPKRSSSPAECESSPAFAPMSHVASVLNDAVGDGCSITDANVAFCDYLLSEMQTLSMEQARALRQHLTRTLLNFMEHVMQM